MALLRSRPKDILDAFEETPYRYVCFGDATLIYKFGTFELNSDRSELRSDGEVVKIEPQVYSLLEILLKHHDRVVSKDEINEHVWGGRIVSDGSIDNRVSAARAAVGDDGRTQNLIKTFPGRGFRFVGDLEIEGDDDAPIVEIPVSHTPTVKTPAAKPKTPWIAIAAGFLIIGGLTVVGLSFREDTQITTPLAQSAQTSLTHKASIAVLPFANMITDQDDKYLGDGLSEEILNVLASIKDLKVASRTSAFTFRNDQANIGQISEALGVEHVLEGSVRKSGKTLRITAQLIQADGDKHLWSKTYDRIYNAENILQIQDDIALEISHRLTAELDLPPLNAPPRIQSLEAYQYFLQGRELAREQQPASLALAVDAYKQAIALEPSYAPVYAELVDVYRDQEFYSDLPIEDALRKMEHVYMKGQAIAPNSPELLRAAGQIADLRGSYAEALVFYERAIAKNSNYAPAYKERAGTLKILGQFQAAEKAYEEALVYDPVSPSVLANLAFLEMRNGDLEGAIETTRKNVRWNPDGEQALNMLGRLLRIQGNYIDAHDNLMTAAKINPEERNVQFYLSSLYLDIGLDDTALQVITRPGIKAIALAFFDQKQNARKILGSTSPNADTSQAAYIIRDADLAYAQYRNQVTNHGLAAPDVVIGEDEPLWFARRAYVLKQNNDLDGDIMLKHLEQYFGNKLPTDFKYYQGILGGAAMYMMKDDPDQALVWIDAALDQGHVFLKLTQEPIFAPLADYPAYAPRLEKMENKAEQYRAIIEGRL